MKAQAEAAMARRLQAARQQKLLGEKVAELTEKAGFAVASGRDDLAEAAITRQVDFEEQSRKLDAVQDQARAEEARLADGLTALEARKAQMQDALSAYEISKREAALGGDGPSHPERSATKKVDAAEAAFDRAMSGAGGVGFTRSDAKTIIGVAEIGAMQKSATVAERLTALKAKQAA